MTHIENIPHILQYGITHKDSQNKNPNYKNIGDLKLIHTRNQKTVKVDNGDYHSKNALPSITLGNFIPFYFGVRMPMLYVTQHGGNFVEQATPAGDIVYLVCSLSEVIASTLDFFFTDGHATDMLTSFYDSTKINDLIHIIEWEAIKSPYWGGSENLNLKRKKQAEFLVAADLSPNLIIGFGCYDEKAKTRLLSFGVSLDSIKTIPQAYY